MASKKGRAENQREPQRKQGLDKMKTTLGTSKKKTATPVAPAKKILVAAKKLPVKKAEAPVAKVAEKAKRPGMDFIGTFPFRKSVDDKKTEAKKLPTGPVFPVGSYKIVHFDTALARAFAHEFQEVFMGRYSSDKLNFGFVPVTNIASDSATISSEIERLKNKEIDILLLNMKDIPLEVPTELTLVSALRREDPRDALITRATYGAIQELPTQARIGCNSKRRLMQVRALRPDLKITTTFGPLNDRLKRLEAGEIDALLVAWATLRRLNHSPRFYVALQPEQMAPAACQGTLGVMVRSDEAELIAKLRYIEDSEASWSARCERAFLSKIGRGRDLPAGVFAHRKGTQDPWILDVILGDSVSGEVLKHREIGTSRCKPESLADKAFVGVLSKGARKFFN
jgi:hydroxymethylbilane synthase